MMLPDRNIQKDRLKKENIYIELKEDYKKVFNNKKYYIRTYGCQMNVHDSEAIKSYLETLGFINTEKIEEANLVVLNTCAIRENARDKVVGFLGKCKYLKKNRDDFKIVIAGCMSEQEDFVKLIQEKYQYVDIVIGTHNIHELPQILIDKYNEKVIEVYSNSDLIIEGMKYQRDSKICAWVNIMYGCDKFCTYCIVPYTRGRERSRKLEDIIKEVESLKKEGYKEVTLLGQNVNAYGRDIDNTFANLLECVAKTGIERIRFMTSHPWNFTDEMIDVIAKYDNIMPHIHLPIQSGSDNILKKMNRRYTKEEYINLFNKIKKKVKNAVITTDIIVGFPNESEEDFKDTLDVVDQLKYDGAFTFIFSPREGTPAAKMSDSVDNKTKEVRLQKLNKLVNKYSLESNKKLLGKEVQVLVLDKSIKDKNKYYGYTDTMKLVNIISNKNIIGNIVNVKIEDAKSFSLDGKVV